MPAISSSSELTKILENKPDSIVDAIVQAIEGLPPKVRIFFLDILLDPPLAGNSASRGN